MDEIAMVRAGVCPECKRGPFKVLANHTFGMHGITSRELRDRVGLTYVESICAPETRQRLSELAIERGTDHIGDARKRKTRRGRSIAGRKIRKEEAARRTPARVLATERSRKTHPCAICGRRVPHGERPRTCSPDCAREARSRKAKARRKAHPCPICGTIVPKARPLTCSAECAKVRGSSKAR